MKIRKLKGCEKIYPENIDGTAEWFYCKDPISLYPDDILLKGDDYVFEGTQLYIIHISGKMLEPIKQEQNVFLSHPVYNTGDNAFAIIKYDFTKKIIQIVKYDIGKDTCSTVGEIPLSKGGDLINLSILENSYMLVKSEILEDTAILLYPFEKEIQLEEHETIHSINGNKLICEKWIEDPDYREEIIIRDFETNQILERKDGYIRTMPNGETWLLCNSEN